MMRIYRSPDGYTFWYEEGTQPVGYEPVEATKPKAASKRRTPANRQAKPANK